MTEAGVIPVKEQHFAAETQCNRYGLVASRCVCSAKAQLGESPTNPFTSVLGVWHCNT